MKTWFLLILLLFFPLSFAWAQSPCVETWGYLDEGQTPLCKWNPPPCYPPQDNVERAPHELSQCGCEVGFSDFDQVWRGPISDSWILQIQIYRACGGGGPLYFYISSDSTAAGTLVLDLTEYNDFSSYCHFSSPWEINLKEVPGFTFVPRKAYYIRVVCGKNSHAICAMRFCANEEIGTEESTWGEIKSFYH